MSQEAKVCHSCLQHLPDKEKKSYLGWLSTSYIYTLYLFIYIYISSHTRLIAIRTFIPLALIYFVYNVTKMVTGLKLQSPKKQSQKREEGEGGQGQGGAAAAAHHWQLQQRGHSLPDARTSKRRRRRLLFCRAALSKLEVLQRHV